MLPEDYVHMKEIITAEATLIPVGDQITQPALQLLKILSQVLTIQKSFLKKKIWGLCTLSSFVFSSSFYCREVRDLQAHIKERLRVGEKIPPAGTSAWEPSCEEMKFLCKGKASAAC